MPPKPPAAADASPWNPRERELLAVTLELLQQNGYDGLTLDAVANKAQASKATVYRRWPTKADLVLAAFIEGIGPVPSPPDTGTLREDLLDLGSTILDHGARHAGTLRAVLVETSNNPALSAAMERQFISERRAVIRFVLQRAVDRGEIASAAVNDELWDLLPGYLMFRSIIPNRPATGDTVRAMVDEVLMPSLTRPTD